jgi:hypothetical protein
MNECDAEQNVFETYGQYEFLKRVYQKYDPTGSVRALLIFTGLKANLLFAVSTFDS